MHSQAHVSKEHQSLIKKIIMIFGIVGFCFFLFFTTNFFRVRQQISNDAYARAEQKNKAIADYISKNIAQLNPLVLSLKQQIERDGANQSAIIEYLQKKPVEVSGLGVIVNSPWYALYYGEHEDKQVLQNLPQSIMHTDWYKQAMAEKKEISGLFFDEETNQPIFYTIAPFYLKANPQQPAGIVFATQSMAHIATFSLRFILITPVTVFYLTNKVLFLLIPENFRVHTKQTIIELANRGNNQKLMQQSRISAKQRLFFYALSQ